MNAFYASLRLDRPDDDELARAVADLEYGVPDERTGALPLADALRWRGTRHRLQGQLDAAVRDLERALELSPGESPIREIRVSRMRIQSDLANCHVGLAIMRDDEPAVGAALRVLVQLEPMVEPSIPAMAAAVRFLVDRRTVDAQLARTIRAVIKQMQNVMEAGHVVGGVRAFAASYVAGTIMLLGPFLTLTWLRAACYYYKDAVELAEGTPPAVLLGLAADARLKLAKLLITTTSHAEEAIGFLEDACAGFELALPAADRDSPNFREEVAHSKLGEALLRLHARSDELQLVERARIHFEASRRLGNESPELVGQLGDCYYRLGRANRIVQQLRHAEELKLQAQRLALSRGVHSVSLRENWSVTARIRYELWKSSADPGDLRGAVQAVCSANVADSSWPWPPFQLAGMVRQHRGMLMEVANGMMLDDRSGLLELAREGRDDLLDEAGARCAVANAEFGHRILGGRRKAVYVLDDPHGLISDTIVLRAPNKTS